jgi:hypothetical protein
VGLIPGSDEPSVRHQGFFSLRELGGCVSSVCACVPGDMFQDFSGNLICTWACSQYIWCLIRVLYDIPVLLAVKKIGPIN